MIAEIRAALANTGLRVITAAPDDYAARRGGALQIERTGGRREIDSLQSWVAYDEWLATAYFTNAPDDAALDAFTAAAWGGVSALAGYVPDTFASEYLPLETGGFRNAEITFTTWRVEAM